MDKDEIKAFIKENLIIEAEPYYYCELGHYGQAVKVSLRFEYEDEPFSETFVIMPEQG